MKSPLGSRKAMERVTLEGGLAAFRCCETGGHYITLGDEFFSRLHAIRDEIGSHPSGAEALAYLQRRSGESPSPDAV